MPLHTVKLLGIAAGSGAGNPGAEAGPEILRELGLVSRLAAAGINVIDLGDIPGGHSAHYEGAAEEISHNLPEVLQVNRHTYAAVLNALRTTAEGTLAGEQGANGGQRQSSETPPFLLIIGGDHSLAIGTLAGISDNCRRLGILWIDAHADFNTPLTSPSGNIHGMSLAVACGRGHRDLKTIAESEPMAEDQDVYLLGCRDIDSGEVENLQDSDVHWLTMQQWRQAGILPTAVAAARELATRCDHVHMSFDIDVIDPQFVPGTGTPVRGGLSIEDARTLLTELGKLNVIGSAEIVEYNPSLDAPDRRTGILTRDLIVTFLESMR